MAAGVVIGITSDFFVGDDKKPVKRVAGKRARTACLYHPLRVSYGLLSCLPSMAGIGVAALGAYKLCEPLGGNYPMFGIGMAAVGMLSVVGMIISNDAYGPIVDNARGVAGDVRPGRRRAGNHG